MVGEQVQHYSQWKGVVVNVFKLPAYLYEDGVDRYQVKWNNTDNISVEKERDPKSLNCFEDQECEIPL